MIVSIVGRQNVGKSSLLNALVGYKRTITYDFPGLTRDNIEVVSNGMLLIDTPGIMFEKDQLAQDILANTLISIKKSHLILYVVDIRNGCTQDDREALMWLRKQITKQSIALIMNKADKQSAHKNITDFYQLGISDMLFSFTTEKAGVLDLENYLINLKQKYGEYHDYQDTKTITASIYGQPNTGKSTLLNKILGQYKSIVSEIAGTTVDNIAGYKTYKNHVIKIVDSAGQKKKKYDPISQLTSHFALNAIIASDIVLVLIDATNGIYKQDLMLIDTAVNNGKSTIVIINKIDIVDPENVVKIIDTLNRRYYNIKNIKHIRISAIKGIGITKLLDGIISEFELLSTRVSTHKLNDLLLDTSKKHQHASVGKGGQTIKFAVHAQDDSFIIFSSAPVDPSYKRYIENKIAATFPLGSRKLQIKFVVK